MSCRTGALMPGRHHVAFGRTFVGYTGLGATYRMGPPGGRHGILLRPSVLPQAPGGPCEASTVRSTARPALGRPSGRTVSP